MNERIEVVGSESIEGSTKISPMTIGLDSWRKSRQHVGRECDRNNFHDDDRINQRRDNEIEEE